jgi:flagellin
LRAQLGGLSRAKKNVSEAITMANTAEGGHQVISDMMVRMRQLAVESATDGITDIERALAQTEISAIIAEMDRMTSSQEYNGHSLLTGTAGSNSDGLITVQAGMRNAESNQMTLTLNAVNSTVLGVDAIDVSTIAGARAAIDAVDAGFDVLNTERTVLGSFINRANIALDAIQANVEQFANGLGGKRDAHIGEESATFSREQVLQQAGVSMLAQANAQANVALKLIG